jgi:hypothetical protein
LTRALGELKKIEENKDDSWLYYYGLNREQFTLEQYYQYHLVYKGLSKQGGLFKEWGIKERWLRIRDLLSFSIKSIYYKILYQSLSFSEGRSQLEGGSLLRGNLTLAEAVEGVSSLSGKYYLKALALEGFPQAKSWYDLVLGREFKDLDLLKEAFEGFNPEWEIQPRNETLREMALLLGAGKAGYYDPIVLQLYSLNPGGLVQYGLKLPIFLQISGKDSDSRWNRNLKRFLKGSGFILRNNSESALILRVNRGDSLNYALSNNHGKVYVSGAVSENPDSSEVLRQWVRSFRSQVFSP